MVNMLEESIVHQCVVYDSILSHNMKIENMQITKQMLSTVKCAHKMHQSELEAKQITADADQQERARKSKLGDEFKHSKKDK